MGLFFLKNNWELIEQACVFCCGSLCLSSYVLRCLPIKGQLCAGGNGGIVDTQGVRGPSWNGSKHGRWGRHGILSEEVSGQGKGEPGGIECPINFCDGDY